MKNHIITFCLLTISFALSAQKSIKELSELPDKKLDKMIQQQTFAGMIGSMVKNYEKQTGKELPNPVVPQLKKVALLSFFTADFSQIDMKAYKRGGTYADFLTGAGGQDLVNQFYQNSIDELKEAFAAKGMELLTPDQFLQTDAHRELYHNYTIEVSKLASGALKAGDFFSKSSSRSIVPVDGYRAFPAATVIGGGDGKAGRDLGKLANELGVDGVLSIQTLTEKEKKEIGLKSLTMALHAPNPVPDDPQINYGLGFYYEGILVESVELNVEPVTFAELPKKATTFVNVSMDGFDVLVQRMIEKLLNSIESDFSGTSSKKRSGR